MPTWARPYWKRGLVVGGLLVLLLVLLIGGAFGGGDDDITVSADESCPAGMTCTPNQAAATCPQGMTCTPKGAPAQPAVAAPAAPAPAAQPATAPTPAGVRVVTANVADVAEYPWWRTNPPGPNSSCGAPCSCNCDCCDTQVKQPPAAAVPPPAAPPAPPVQTKAPPPAAPPPSAPPPAPACPKTAAEVIARGLPALPWVDESGPSDVCKWQAHFADIPNFNAPPGTQVDFDLRPGQGRACPGGPVIGGYNGDITARFVYTQPCVPAYAAGNQQPPATAGAAPPPPAGGKSPEAIRGAISALAGCTATALPPNGAKVTCSAPVTFTVPNGFVVVTGPRATAGQSVTASVMSVYDER